MSQSVRTAEPAVAPSFADQLRGIVERQQARKALKAQATRGPWRHGRAADGRGSEVYALGDDESIRPVARTDNPADAAFLAACRNDDVEADLDALLVQLRRCEALLDHHRAQQRDARLRANWEM